MSDSDDWAGSKSRPLIGTTSPPSTPLSSSLPSSFPSPSPLPSPSRSNDKVGTEVASSSDIGTADQLHDSLGVTTRSVPLMPNSSPSSSPLSAGGRRERHGRRTKKTTKSGGRGSGSGAGAGAARRATRDGGLGNDRMMERDNRRIGRYSDWAKMEEGMGRGAKAGRDGTCVPSSPMSCDHFYNNDTEGQEDVYIVRQRYGYCSIFFSVVQTIILAVMMWQCDVAPLNINPMFGPYPDALNYWGAKNAVLIIEDKEEWRLLTPILLHAGVIHLLCNASVQLETGAFFEREWGSATWLAVYLLSAIGSSILSSCFMPDSISVGSSGAVMGLFGAKLSEVFCRACESRKTRQGRIGHEVRMEQLNGVLCSVTLVGLFSFIPYVDWAAHLGGLVAGMTVGLVTFSFSIQSKLFVALWFVVGVGSTIVAFVLALRYMFSEVEPAGELRDVCGYYKQFFDDYECNCQLGN